MAQQYIDISSGSQYYYTSSYSVPGGGNKLLNFYSINHLYYSLFDSGSGMIDSTGSFDNYLESSINISRSLDATGEGIVYSIPQKLYGSHLEPNTISIVSSSVTITDDGQGNLFDGSTQVGNVIYSHGMLIVTDPTYAKEDVDSITFKSNVPIYTQVYNIKVSDYEFNHTLNPTAQTGSTILSYSGSSYLQQSGVYLNAITGSDFQPYITAVGLYNDSNELIAVGKLAQPLPKPADTELTIQVKIDV